MSYTVRLRKNSAQGRIVGELGPFASQATAIAQAKGLAPTTAHDIAVTVEKASAAAKKNPLPMRANSASWHGRVMRYPKGVMTGRDSFHEGPDDFSIDQTGYYVWDGHGSPRGHGKWSLLGPFKDKATATAAAGKLHATKSNPAKKKAGQKIRGFGDDVSIDSSGNLSVERRKIDTSAPGDYGYDHVEGAPGMVRLVPSGRVMTLAEAKAELAAHEKRVLGNPKKKAAATVVSGDGTTFVVRVARTGSEGTVHRGDSGALTFVDGWLASYKSEVEDAIVAWFASSKGKKSNPHPTFAPSQPGRRRIPPRNRVSLGAIPGRPNPSGWNPKPFQAGDGAQNLIMVNPAGKLPTYKQAMSKLYDAFAARGYKMSPASLKIPHATHPQTDVRFWFRPQEVYSSFGAKGDAHTVTGHAGIDVRKYVGSEQSLASLVTWLEKHGQPMR